MFDSMLAITHPAPDIIELAKRPDPVPGERQILVAVRAAGLNRADLLQRAGKYPAPPGWPADIPGLEYAGEVAAVGAGVKRWTVGDRVMGLVGGGAHAEFVVVDERETMRIPAAMNFTDAAAIPEAFLTAWDALWLRGRAVAGDRVLVHTIGSGVGTAAAQIGRALGLAVIGTSRTAAKLERCRALGMSAGVLMPGADWPARVGDPVQVIIDTLGAQAFAQNLGLLSAAWSVRCAWHDDWRSRSGARSRPGAAQSPGDHRHGDASAEPRRADRAGGRFVREVLPMFGDGRLAPVVDRVVPMREIDQAHRALQENRTFGKVVLEW